ncbi:hypothetical protein L226DRAFT_212458 [Lentinus tigrinus ALCF2SS1-7]|uniref:uncharacterized protein n=1 Tax=Lentinus tigrinus ALCF2SS1-7 TaxID=1328758 RepID=UPI001165C984|nr:hypothetical protein L226DRAFT_212458 [Lentinus tigrinus ALCF2SS1-7]
MAAEETLCSARAELQRTATFMSLESVYRSIDCAISVLADLRQQLNNFAPVHRLPPELFSIIFTLATHIPRRHQDVFRLQDDRRSRDYVQPRSNRIAIIGQVCRRWRAITLDTPGLWTYINVAPGCNQFKAYLKRSRSLPVSLSLNAGVPEVKDALSQLAPRLSRLDLTITLLPSEEITPSIFCINAPLIRCATLIDTHVFLPMPRLDHDPGPDVKWIELFGQRESTLEALALALPTTWLPSNTFTHLTHLLFSCHSVISMGPSVLLTLLANTPRLEFLHIINLWYYNKISTLGAQPVTLNHLRSLVVDGSRWQSLCHFVARLSIPVRAHVTIVNTQAESLRGVHVPPLDHKSPVTNLEIYVIGRKLQVFARSEVLDFVLHWWPDDGYDVPEPELHKFFTPFTVTSFKLKLTDTKATARGTDKLLTELASFSAITDVEVYLDNQSPSLSHGPSYGKVLHAIAVGNICPALSHFILTIEGSFPVDHLISSAVEMARERASRGSPLSRVVVRSLSGSPYRRGLDITPEYVDLLRAKFAPYVNTLEVHHFPEPPMRVVDQRWVVGGAEKHWSLYEGAKPQFLGPYEWESAKPGLTTYVHGTNRIAPRSA